MCAFYRMQTHPPDSLKRLRRAAETPVVEVTHAGRRARCGGRCRSGAHRFRGSPATRQSHVEHMASSRHVDVENTLVWDATGIGPTERFLTFHGHDFFCEYSNTPGKPGRGTSGVERRVLFCGFRHLRGHLRGVEALARRSSYGKPSHSFGHRSSRGSTYGTWYGLLELVAPRAAA